MDVEIGIVVPVYRNAATLVALRERLVAALDPLSRRYELLFVEDAGGDDSLSILRAMARDDPRVAVLALARNVGQHRAVMEGLARSRGRVVVVLDADLQDPPEAVPRLLAALTGPVEAVFAGRRGAYESAGRLVTSRAFKHLLSLITGGRLPIDAGLFVAMTRRMVDRIVASREPTGYVAALMARTGLPMASIPVERASSSGSSYDTPMRLGAAWNALRTLFRFGGRSEAPAPVREFTPVRPESS